jgi:hypothetical protein
MRCTSYAERVRIQTLAQSGATDAQIAAVVGWSQRTVRKWRRRAQRDTPDALASLLGRPANGSLSTFPHVVVEHLTVWRTQHPGWGPATLRAELARCPALVDTPLPSCATIARWLATHGYSRRYQRRRPLPKPPDQAATQPHQCWELDAEGVRAIANVGVVALVNLVDRASHLKLLSLPCWLGDTRAQHHPTTADVQLVLRHAFVRWGLPDRLAVDRDSIYYDNLSASPFPTRLHLWLTALGITVEIGPPHRPTVRAQIERSHQLWYHQVIEGQHFRDWSALVAALEARLAFLNLHLPCATLDDRPPLVAFPDAQLPRRRYRLEAEAELLDPAHIDALLATGEWFRQASVQGAVSLGQQRYALGRAWARREVRITFDPASRELTFASADQVLARRLPLRGCEPATLIGDAARLLLSLPNYQLALPLTPADWRVTHLCETVGGTTY